MAFSTEPSRIKWSHEVLLSSFLDVLPIITPGLNFTVCLFITLHSRRQCILALDPDRRVHCWDWDSYIQTAVYLVFGQICAVLWPDIKQALLFICLFSRLKMNSRELFVCSNLYKHRAATQTPWNQRVVMSHLCHPTTTDALSPFRPTHGLIFVPFSSNVWTKQQSTNTVSYKHRVHVELYTL